MGKNNVGSKRLVVGASYGLFDWMAQRATAIVMAIFTVILLILLFTGSRFNYEGWAGLFAQQWFKMVTFAVVICLLYHVWVGMRNIWMDYGTKSVVLRLVLQLATVLWLIGCAGWAAQILWRV